MTLSLGSEPGSGGGGDWQDTNGDEPSKPKRMRQNEGDQYFVCDFDILGATDSVFSSINVEDVLKEQICKYSRLSSLANMERKFLEIDIAFYRMEYQIQKLKEKKSLEKTSALNIPDVHFFDAFVRVDRNFKIPDPTSRRPDPPLPTHTPSNVSTLSKASAGCSDEITPVGNYPPVPYNHPPQGPVVHMKLEISSKVLATRTFPLGEFYKARIIQIHEPSKKSKSEPMYLVRPEARKGIPSSLALKWHCKRELAYADHPAAVLNVGTRVVAPYSDESSLPRQSLYAGIIAEPPKPLNRFRYLVIFDYGYAQYVDIDKLFVMCGASKNVWEDMFQDIRGFVRDYLEKYPEQPMLWLRKGQVVKTEWMGDWCMARVVTVDSSMVKMLFEVDKHTEWIYRGSTRLSPLYSLLKLSVKNKATTGDLTYGKEQMIVPCVNSIDDTYPTFAEYSSERYAGKGVDLNLDKEFLCGCDCEDDCQDREKCSCQKLTVEATEALASGRNPYAGYFHRRLLEPHITGVYECNSQCHCSRRCFNRVVQNGLRSRLQVFKTEKRGWGIRCLDDLPHGTFICVYSGQLLTEQGANEDGNQYGDEYLAELDHIEVVEKQKEGYESDVAASGEHDTDDSVHEEEICEDVPDSDYGYDCADVPKQPSSTMCKQMVKSLANDSSHSNKSNYYEGGDSDSNDRSQKPTKKCRTNNSSKSNAKKGSPQKYTCDESEDSRPSTNSENAKASKKLKKRERWQEHCQGQSWGCRWPR
ncbi:hypothetical protein V5799_006530 [Amblyomma americanum]|uniref:Pre-SET domain-containing protein n=1 Tax=Amblyomma americanum TaxID=6943 RepID=A0AAQ4DW50_AMBAM